MNQLATITSKMQLTLPITIARKIGLKKGQKVAIEDVKGKIVITPMKSLVEAYAGSVSIPKKFKNKSLDEIIEEAKMKYFKKSV